MIWRRFFGRRPTRSGPDTAETWRAGDLAVCIIDPGEWRSRFATSRMPDPALGELVRVRSVAREEHHGRWRTMLYLAGWPDDCRYSASGFRKPVADHAPADADFTNLIRDGGRRSPAPTPEPLLTSPREPTHV